MDRKTANGILIASFLFAAVFLGVALSTVITFGGGDAQNIAVAQESMKSAMDAEIGRAHV